MRIILIGYGKMGKTIDRLALAAGDEVVARIDSSSRRLLSTEIMQQADVAIEFTRPDQAVDNLRACIDAGLPVVTGTTGWYDRLKEVENHCSSKSGAVLYASNFSIGVHIFFEINQQLARIMNRQPQYEKLSVHETHHVHKVDAPSGTAITLAEEIIRNYDRINAYKGLPEGSAATDPGSLPVFYSRIDEVPGTHTTRWESAVDRIEVTHLAHNRDGFASGALTAARWLIGKKGTFTMTDLLRF